MATRTRPNAGEPTAETVVDRFRPLTEADIRAMTDPSSFDRGRSYARGRRIYDTTLRGDTLRAGCVGSSGGPYLVEATLSRTDAANDDPSPIVDYLCTCPRGGFCKHVVALLLTWREAPERFVVRPSVAELLAGKSREDLIALVELMVRRDPELADLIELAPPAPAAAATGGAVAPAEPGAGATRTVSLSAIRRQVTSAFSAMVYDGGWGWDAGASIAGEIAPLREIGDGNAAAGRYADALVVYRAILEEGTAHWEETGDEGGELLAEIGWAAAGLARCLEVQADLPETDRLRPGDRADLLETLFEYWRFAGEYDQIADAPDAAAVIAAHATDEERATVEGWLRAAIAGGDRHGLAAVETMGGDGGMSIGAGPSGYVGYTGYAKRRAIHFLMDLKAAGGAGDEELLAEYQAAELWDDVAATLLRLGRVDEAIGLAARKLGPLDLIAFADRLIQLDGDHVTRAFDLVEGWLWEKEGTSPVHEQTVLTRLQDRYAAHGRPDRSLDAARRRFKAAPGVQTYHAVRTAATLPNQTSGTWDELRPALQAELREGNAWSALVEIHLEEGSIAEAIKALHREEAGQERPSAGWGWSGAWGLDAQRRRVAEAAETDYPDEAIRLYRVLAEAEIQRRQRTHYQAAAGHLARAKTVYLNQGRADEWQAYIAELRETNKRLRALREELGALGLR